MRHRWSQTHSPSARPSSRCFRTDAPSEVGRSPSASPRHAMRARHGRTGLLPGVSDSSPQPGPADRASDPVVAYDAVHGAWLAATLGISDSAYYFYVNRSTDGLTWSAPVAAVSGRAGELDKEWIACDNGAASPFRGNCYLSYFHVGSGQIRTTTSSDGGLTWSTSVASSPNPPSGVRLQRRSADSAAQRHARRPVHRVWRLAGQRSERDRRHPVDGWWRLVLGARACRAALDRVDSRDPDVRPRVGRDRRRRPHLRNVGGLPERRHLRGESHRHVDICRRGQLDARTGSHLRHRRSRPLPPGDRSEPGRDGLRSSTTRSPTTAPTYPAAPASTSTRRPRGTAGARGRGSNG